MVEVSLLSELADMKLLDELLKFPLELDPLACLQCGKCTSGCTVMVLMENYPSRVVERVRLGLIPALLKSDLIWACTQCQKCRDACPQKVSPVEVFIALRNLAVLKGESVPQSYLKMLSTLLERGFIQEEMKVLGSDSIEYDRSNLNLPLLKGPKNLEKFQMNVMKAFEKEDV
ncbi:MAG: 4Fe-4S dicluster domain-containing protein [archaeon GB-1867-097]|nr:4Fe-4S dicluster domain-containing protein [Candidatus Culexmicrobium thermophilum]MCS7385007.1 4Fe-4S dicluster domain-containing protein [Candidatus Culexmicrobium thermophilum]RLE56534.1 MAG: hypothetical protein DRJ30_01715 [Candidatus Verstraetearchaeota archaeon]HDO20355.1 hypothetical protein [Candidatus Bathyarchaeota archaeon]